MKTMAGNMQGYSKRQVKDGKRARDLLRAIGCPTPNAFKTMIRAGMLKNCLVTVEDIDTIVGLFGKNVPTLKGEITRKR